MMTGHCMHRLNYCLHNIRYIRAAIEHLSRQVQILQQRKRGDMHQTMSGLVKPVWPMPFSRTCYMSSKFSFLHAELVDDVPSAINIQMLLPPPSNRPPGYQQLGGVQVNSFSATPGNTNLPGSFSINNMRVYSRALMTNALHS
jgi:hypothetical protein